MLSDRPPPPAAVAVRNSSKIRYPRNLPVLFLQLPRILILTHKHKPLNVILTKTPPSSTSPFSASNGRKPSQAQNPTLKNPKSGCHDTKIRENSDGDFCHSMPPSYSRLRKKQSRLFFSPILGRLGIRMIRECFPFIWRFEI